MGHEHKSYEALNIPSLELNEGTAYGFVGHNGAGKTTLFKCITNINCTYEGEIYLDDQSVKKHNEILVKTGIVLDGQSVYKNRTGWFNIEYFASLRGNYNEEKAKQLAAELNITDFLDKKVSHLSYGTQKKLILLIALLNDPEVLILDEPFRGLDFETVAWFKQYLKTLTDQGVMLLISSHVRNDLEALCDEVYVINQGKIIDHLDLNEEREKQLRIIDTNNNQLTCQLLEQAQYEHELTEDNKIKLDISNPKWNEVYQSIMEQKIEINEMSKVKILEDKLN